MPTSQATPACLSILVCDHVQLDPATGKATLFGCFENITASTFPAAIKSLSLYAELTDGRGDTPLTVKFVRTTAEAIEGEVLGSWDTFSLNFQDPRMIRRATIAVQGIAFPEPGEYRFILETQGRFIAERRIVAQQKA